MIGGRHDDYRANMAVLAPFRKDRPLGLGAIRPLDFLNVRNAQRQEQTASLRRLVFVREAAAKELLVDRIRRITEHGHSLGDAAMDKVGRLERTRCPRIERQNDDVRGGEWLADDEDSTSRAEQGIVE